MAAGAPPPEAPLCVLVVDDDEDIVLNLAEGLEMCGHVVLTAHSAAQARAVMAGREDIGVVITDIRMPGEDGLKLAQQIMTGRPDEAAIEVVVITGHATVQDAAAAIRLHVFDFLPKPFTVDAAAEAVERGLARARSRRADGAHRRDLLRRTEEAERARAEMERLVGGAEGRLSAMPSGFAPAEALRRELHAISHALRTPLHAIAGGADLLKLRGGTLDDAAARDDMAMLQDGVQRAVEAVALVEELHRTDATPPGEEPAPLDLSLAITRLAQRLQRRDPPPEAALVVEGGAGVLVRCLPNDLRRVIDLCADSALAWASPGASVVLAAQPAANGMAEARFAVRASESGPDQPAPVLSDFARTQEDLRFAIARRLAERHGGSLTSTGGADGAMTMRLLLPAA
ncbi:ATP-binding response regulator [Falsiroseomonas ponticola]|uniref:ATP-binding response regulator n=1 Tax=Falsiroseomonas ponticola TaxID=2786951 RepID=UPI001932C055|nr:hybrid sensor histidine kinase/response regulator [Roseomonas ponticola]